MCVQETSYPTPVKSVGTRAIPPDNGGNFGDNLWKSRVTGDVLQTREVGLYTLYYLVKILNKNQVEIFIIFYVKNLIKNMTFFWGGKIVEGAKLK